jgi:hypothetical protein
MAAKQAEHGTVGSGYAIMVEKEDSSGRMAVWPLLSGRATLGIGERLPQ